MKQTLVLLLTAAVLFATAHRLPAPISEIPEPTTTPRKAKSKPPAKTQSTNAENESRSRSVIKKPPTPAASFAGAWTGTVNGQWQKPVDGNPLFSGGFSCTYLIQISPDEKTISVEEKDCRSGHVYLRQSQIACRREGDSLAWNYEQRGGFLHPRWIGTCILRINSDGTASLAEDREYKGIGVEGYVLKNTGTLTKQ